MSTEAEFSIPPLPHILLRVLQYDYSSPDAGASDMERIIEPDKSICSEILRVANSAYYGRSGRIRNLRDAITLMGLRVLKNLVIYISTRQMTGHLSQPIYRKYLNEFPVVSALLARDLAVRLQSREIADEAFLAALLHKIGMSMLALKKSDEYARLLEKAEKTGMDLRSSEQQLFGTDHMQLGQMAALQWNLPGELAKAMAADAGMEPRACSALQRITLLSSFMGARITEIPLPTSVTEMIDRNPEALGIDRNTWDEFLSPEFVGKLKEHPYYQLTAS